MGCAGYMRKPLIENQYKVKTTGFHFSSCMGVSLGDKADQWVKDFGYIHWTEPQIQLASIATGPVWGRTTGNAVTGGWDNYDAVHEHMRITNLFLNKFTKITNFLWRFLPVEWTFQMLGYQIYGSLLYLFIHRSDDASYLYHSPGDTQFVRPNYELSCFCIVSHAKVLGLRMATGNLHFLFTHYVKLCKESWW